jgi:hypothetical protein
MKSTGISALAAPPDLPAATLPPALLNRLSWTELAGIWPTLARSTRRRLARAAGRMLHALWVSREDLARVPPETWQWEPAPSPRLVPPELGRARLPLRLTAADAEETLADWYEASRSFAATAEQIAFTRGFFDLEVLDRHGRRHAWNTIRRVAARQARRRARQLEQRRRREHRPGAAAAGVWIDPSVSPDDLLVEVQRALQDPGRVVIKEGPGHRILRARVFGHDVLLKCYERSGAAERAKYWFRRSRARRAWCAASVMRDLDLPTPEPLGYVEAGVRRAPAACYFMTAFLPSARSVRAWVKECYRDLNPPARAAFRRQLAAFLLDLPRAGIYHADTKALNLLIDPTVEGAPRLWWIDMDGVQPGHRPTRYQVLRNLVQLNGSIRSWVPEDERLDFLRRIGAEYPWLRRPGVVPRLRRWTERRLRKEIRTRCGP